MLFPKLRWKPGFQFRNQGRFNSLGSETPLVGDSPQGGQLDFASSFPLLKRAFVVVWAVFVDLADLNGFNLEGTGVSIVLWVLQLKGNWGIG